MVEAGAEVVETDTFQASRLKLEEWGLAEHTLEINRKAAEIARRAVGEDRFVAGSIGPTGLPPRLRRPDARADPLPRARRDLRRAGARARRGRRRPADHRDRAGHPRGEGRDLRRARGVQGGRPHACRSRLGLACSRTAARCCSAPTSPRSLTTLEALKVDVIGLNCSTGPEDMRDAIRFLGEHSTVPVHCIPNAGLPLQGPDGETIFPEKPDPLAEALGEFVERYGVSIVGGCCGTTPEHIARDRRALRRPARRTAAPRARAAPQRLSSMIAATRARAGPGADARRRARQLAGLAQGQGAAAGRRLRRPACRSPRTRSRAARTCSTSASR